ncbi:ABC transporter ATP-binding protein [Parachitinimonas caeni]|uniref:ABC transporter ATP-binding protein n=1 Tax=Parachitinimonas caeni TaxID=3031301 RepID=A0ABT7DVS2_9NEIS|nr:ABC transporter ATP-binding protein [Parachitinimonas caeni]MDK2123265.1 ABC transporter ATP-binding protein [Parachitinimonas caeni]
MGHLQPPPSPQSQPLAPASRPQPPILAVESVTKHYRRGSERIVALTDLSFSIDAPEVVAIAGPSGSGKSTLLNLLARFDVPDSGEVRLDGQDLASISPAALDEFRNRKLGFVFQQFNLLPVLSALENVELALAPQALSRAQRRERAIAMLERVGMGYRLAHKPGELSGGQQQRVAIARALVGRPRFVIADEPTGNLDSKTAAEILQLISELNQTMQTTFVIATHDPRVMQLANSVIELADGQRIG